MEWPVLHVSAIPGNTATKVGNCNLEDEDIAKWCAAAKRVLVTCDSDFRSKWVKGGELAKHGVEVIVFARNLEGPHEQHHQITLGLPRWDNMLGALPFGYRVWEQRASGLFKQRR